MKMHNCHATHCQAWYGPIWCSGNREAVTLKVEHLSGMANPASTVLRTRTMSLSSRVDGRGSCRYER